MKKIELKTPHPFGIIWGRARYDFVPGQPVEVPDDLHAYLMERSAPSLAHAGNYGGQVWDDPSGRPGEEVDD